MNAPFSFTRKLSDEQRAAIELALRNHRIEIGDEAFCQLCQNIEKELNAYLKSKERKKPAKSRAETRKEIESFWVFWKN